MIYKLREKRLIHRAYEVLRNRMVLSDSDNRRYYRIERGHDGESQLDVQTDELTCEALVLNDLQLEVNESEFQIDALILLPDRLLMYEVKNWEGNYIWGPEHYQIHNTRFTSPQLQTQTARAKLGLLTREIGCRLPIENYLLFINPNFMLWDAPSQGNLLLHSHLPAHMEMVDRTGGKLTDEHFRWAKELARRHDPEYRDKKWPIYSYAQLKKGLACPCCGSLRLFLEGYSVCCMACGRKSKITFSILKTIQDYQLLFPGELLTTARMRDWCGGMVPHDSIYRVLKQHYAQSGTVNQVHYLPK